MRGHALPDPRLASTAPGDGDTRTHSLTHTERAHQRSNDQRRSSEDEGDEDADAGKKTQEKEKACQETGIKAGRHEGGTG